MIIDTHTHYDDERFSEDRGELLSSLGAHGIDAVVNVGSTWESLEITRALGWQYERVYTAYGIHPDEVGCLSEERLEEIRGLCRRDEKCVAVGEIGLDYHWMTETKELAREYLNMGVYLGIGGVATFRNGRKLKEVVAYAPLQQLVLETDCPYLAPEPHRGRRNSSQYLPLVADAIAEIKGIAAEEVVEATAANARRLFHKLPQKMQA